MGSMKVTIEQTKGGDGRDHILRDNDSITIGRYTVIEKDPGTKSAMIRLRFYKNQDADLMKAAVQAIAKSLIWGGEVFKLNIITSSETMTSPFTSSGFTLEGILVNNSYQDSIIASEFLFGTDATRFRSVTDYKLLALEGKSVDLRLATPEDAEAFLRYYTRNKEFLSPFEPRREDEFYTIRGQKKALEDSYRAYLAGSAINFGIFLKGSLIGKIQISGITYGSFRSAIVGYGLGKDTEGKGYMQDALSTVIDYSFEELGLHRLEASTLPENLRSQKTLEYNGFRKVGFNEKYLYISGEWRDHLTFSLVKERYLEKRDGKE